MDIRRSTRNRKTIFQIDEDNSDIELINSQSSQSSVESQESQEKKVKSKKRKPKVKLEKTEKTKTRKISPKKAEFIDKIKEQLIGISLDEESEDEIIKCITGIYQEKEKDYIIEYIERVLKRMPLYKNDDISIKKIIETNNDKNKIVILSGLPGVGKSTFSDKLQENQEFQLLSLDKITKGTYFPKVDAMKKHLMKQITEKDENYILDGTFLDYKEIDTLIESVNKKVPNKYVVEIVYLNISPRFAYLNNAMRCVNEILLKGVEGPRRKTIPYPVYRGFKKQKEEFDKEIIEKELYKNPNFNIIEPVDEIKKHDTTYESPKFFTKSKQPIKKKISK